MPRKKKNDTQSSEPAPDSQSLTLKTELPAKWVWTTLGEIRRDASQSIPQAEMRGKTFELYSVPSFATGKPEIVEGDQIGSNKVTVQPGDVLICKINPRINRAWVVGESHGYPQIASTEWIVFSKQDGIIPDYLRYYFSTDTFRNYLAANVSGVGGSLMRVRPIVVERYPFPLAPTAEQERIVAKLDTMFSRIAAGESAARRALERLDCYRASVLHAAVTGELTREWRKTHKPEETGKQLLKRLLIDRHNNWHKNSNLDSSKQSARNYREPNPPQLESTEDIPHGWTWATLEQLTSQVATGATPLRSNSDYWNNGTISWVTSGATNADFIQSASAYITELAITETNAKLFPKGTLLLAMYGEGKTRGMVSELDIDAATNQACAALLFQGDNRIIQPYVKLFLKKNYEDIRRMASGGVQPNLSLDIVKRMCLPLPPLEEQFDIKREVDLRFSAADQVTLTLNKQLENADLTRQSTLSEAFTGRLVPQDPNDEAFSVALDRIHFTRQTEAKQTKAKRMSKIKANVARRSLLDVLREHKKPITPEQLFQEAGFLPTDADLFYRELASLRKIIREKKPSGQEARAWPYRAKVLLELEEK